MKSKDFALLVLRVVAGAMLIVFHGWGKLNSAVAYFLHAQEWGFLKGVSGLGFPYPVFFASCSVLAETIGSLFLILGLFTRYAALLLVINMSVAIYRHLTSDFRYELAAMYGVIALTFVFLHPGSFSLDARVRKTTNRNSYS